MNLHEYQAKQLFFPLSHPGDPGRSGGHTGPGQRRGGSAGRQALGGEGPGPRRWSRQGRRGQARPQRRGGASGRRGDARLAPQDQADRCCRPAGEPGVRRDGQQHRAGAVPLLLVDRARERVALLASAAGGMDIEEVAAKTPEKILTVAVHPAAGLQAYQVRQIGYSLGLSSDQIKQFIDICQKLYRLFCDCDAGLIEINPLIVTQRRQPARAGCEDQYRGQRPVPPGGAAGDARPVPGGRDGAARGRARSELRFPRRQHRLHGQRRWPRHGDDGPDQAAWRRARQLPRRRRRRDAGSRCGRVQADPLQPGRAGDPRQHLRRHRALRPDRGGHHPGGARNQCARSGGGSAGRHERRAGARVAGEIRPRHHGSRGPDGRCAEGRGAATRQQR